jgi:glutaredoxin
MLLGAAAGLAQAGAIYKQVAPDGRITYTDRPPPGAKVEVAAEAPNPPPGAAPAAVPPAPQRGTIKPVNSSASGGVVLYVTSWCPYCRKAQDYLSRKGIRYSSVDIETPRGRDAYRAAGGGGGVPLMVSGARRVQGYSEGSYDAFFRD